PEPSPGLGQREPFRDREELGSSYTSVLAEQSICLLDDRPVPSECGAARMPKRRHEHLLTGDGRARGSESEPQVPVLSVVPEALVEASQAPEELGADKDIRRPAGEGIAYQQRIEGRRRVGEG